VVLAGLALVASPALRADQPAGASSYELTWSAIAGGGERGTGGSFRVETSLGEPDAFRAQAGAFVFRGSFWSAFLPPEPIFADGFETGDSSRWSLVTP
jgi:hypothetical protein